MMDFMTGSSLSNVLAPKLEVGQEALYDALRSRDTKRATRIVKRVAREGNGNHSSSRGERAGRGGSSSSSNQRAQETDLNAADSRGLRPIHLAAMGGMSETVAALLEAGVPVNAMGAEGNTALHLASWHREEGVVAVLMRAGASPTQDNVKGKTPIDLASTETTLTLLCPLHYCAARGMLDNLVSEVEKGRSVNSVGRGADTPLHAAATTGNTDATRLLLARGADPLRKNAAGETPLDVARRKGWEGEGGRTIRGDIVGVLEGACGAAASAKAEEAAKQARAEYREGEAVVYMRNGEGQPAVVVKVHRDDEEPYYTVRVHETGRERQTDANHLCRSMPETSGTRDLDCDELHARSVDGGVEDAGGVASPAGLTTGCEGASSEGCVAEAVEGDKVGSLGNGDGGCGGGRGGTWEVASTILLDLAAAADRGSATGKAATGRRRNADLAQSLTAAFAAMPPEEMGAILARKLCWGEGGSAGGLRQANEGDDANTTLDDRDGSGIGVDDVRGEIEREVNGNQDGVAVSGDGVRGRGDGHSEVAVDGAERCRQEKGREGGQGHEGTSHQVVVADACREVVLACLSEARKGGEVYGGVKSEEGARHVRYGWEA